MVVVANIFGLISALLVVYMGSIKEKKTVLRFQIVQTTMGTICDAILGGIPSVICNIFTIIRNILVDKGKFGKVLMAIFIILCSGLIIYFNKWGWIGYIPLANFIFYTIFINTKDNILFKYVFIISMTSWLIYDFIIKAYTSSIFDLFTVIVAIITLFKMKKEK